MIQRLSHTCLYVLDQERARRFYTETLGFEVRNDMTLGTFRWLTVGPKGQPDLEIVLMDIQPSPFMDEEACATLRKLIEKGGVSGGVFATADCKKTYEELKAKGVEFVHPPTERPYGIEALLKDDSGNWFSMVQRPQ
jgi:catechol 2,3-dioxygenase-like lactoylglutathione lyase family enzyme